MNNGTWWHCEKTWTVWESLQRNWISKLKTVAIPILCEISETCLSIWVYLFRMSKAKIDILGNV